MKVCHPFICLLFLAGLQDGGLGPVQAETYTELEGRNITVSCSFYLTGRKMYFCKKDCSRENILVETTDYRAQRGRYSIEFNKTGTASYFLLVSITELKRSDSGWYRCGLDQTWIRHMDFEIVVNYDSPAATPTSTQSLSFSPVSSSSSETTKQSKRSAPPPGALHAHVCSYAGDDGTLLNSKCPCSTFCRAFSRNRVRYRHKDQQSKEGNQRGRRKQNI
ncbi:CMRF35-like molecule 6 [Girardinichthys multiradiatus]|uniref:CMRF35-like molecule 6 n=1 Tax=Girardinichthys multiradiatus TaxID=208333 RepID=UPI001FAE4EB6|nr:CMRF35-like molecule 6 [Girardinichthys multiradiatus]